MITPTPTPEIRAGHFWVARDSSPNGPATCVLVTQVMPDYDLVEHKPTTDLGGSPSMESQEDFLAKYRPE